MAIFTVFIVYGFLSIKWSKTRFTGPTSRWRYTEYAANGFEFGIYSFHSYCNFRSVS